LKSRLDGGGGSEQEPSHAHAHTHKCTHTHMYDGQQQMGGVKKEVQIDMETNRKIDRDIGSMTKMTSQMTQMTSGMFFLFFYSRGDTTTLTCDTTIFYLWHDNVTPMTSGISKRVAERCRVLQSVAVCCSVLQCVAVCCSALQHDAKDFRKEQTCCSVWQCVAVCGSVLQRVAVGCSV